MIQVKTLEFFFCQIFVAKKNTQYANCYPEKKHFNHQISLQLLAVQISMPNLKISGPF